MCKKKTKNKQITIKCPYCGKIAKLVNASFVHGEKTKNKNQLLYVCSNYPSCDSYVRADSSKKPLGSLANKKLRQLRMEAHRYFDAIWKNGIMTRSEAYKWLDSIAGTDRGYAYKDKYAHIGQYSNYMCEFVIAESKKVLANNKCNLSLTTNVA